MKILAALLAIFLLASSCNGYCYESVTVSDGDTCDSIGSAYSVSTDDLMSYNPGLDCNNLQAGQQVCLYDPDFASEEEENSSVDAQNPPAEEVEEEQTSNVEEEEQNPSVEEEQVEENPNGGEESPSEEEQNSTEEEENSNVGEEEQNPSGEEENLSEEEEALSEFAERVIAAHQVFRDSFGSPELIWNYTLNASAYQWAIQNAANKTMEHSTALGAFSIYGENIAASQYSFYNSSGVFPIIQPYEWYVNTWGAEWQYFVNGSVIFDNSCSTTGNWYNVAHFTQVIWKTSTSVGCGFAINFDYAVMVCQYYPSGNRVDYPIY